MATKSLDGVLTKKAHRTEKFTEDQVSDLLKCADQHDGYLYFLARNAGTYQDLWRTDGTSLGTQIINPNIGWASAYASCNNPSSSLWDSLLLSRTNP